MIKLVKVIRATVRPLAGWALVLAAGLLLTACREGAEPADFSHPPEELGQVVPVEGGGQYVDIGAQQLRTMLQSKGFFFANVHVPYEGEIEGTDAFVAFDQVESKLAEFPQDKGARIVLYCRSGRMSAIAARALVGAGFTSVYNLDGGFRAWEAAGYELIQDPKYP